LGNHLKKRNNRFVRVGATIDSVRVLSG